MPNLNGLLQFCERISPGIEPLCGDGGIISVACQIMIPMGSKRVD